MPRPTETCLHSTGVDTSETGNPKDAAKREDCLRIARNPRLQARRNLRVETGLFCIFQIRLTLQCAGMRCVMEQDSCITSIVLFSQDGLKRPCQGSDAVGVQAILPQRVAERGLHGRAIGTKRGYCESARAPRARRAIRLPIVSVEISGRLAFMRYFT